MCYTSGTTGNPKGVVYSHRSTVLHAMALLFADSLALSERDVCLPVVPQFHATAWGTPYAALLCGASLALTGQFVAEPRVIAELCAAEAVTVAVGVPTVWFGLLAAVAGGTVDPAQLASLQRVVVGGSALPETLLRGLDDLGIAVVNTWGMTETSPVGSVARVKSTVAPERVDAVRLTQGLPLPGLKVRVVTDVGDEAPHDGHTLGELQINGPWVADAYYDPAAPDLRGGLDRFTTTADGTRWLHTGDVAVIDPDGYITLLDRTKDLVKSGGEWISSVLLENLLMAHPKVAEAAVVAVPDARWGERPLACVVLSDTRADRAATAEELRAHLAGLVPRWQVPDEIVFIDEVPKTSVGKFDKKALRARFGGVAAP
jgi:fatty-acyl-CoA synthase